MRGDLFHIISEPDWSYRRVKGGDEILHELVITLPVAPVLLVRIDATLLARIILHKHRLADVYHISFSGWNPCLENINS